MNDKKKRWLSSAPNATLEHILNTLGDAEAAKEPSNQYPLAGLIHLEGVGQVPVAAIRSELARRELEAS